MTNLFPHLPFHSDETPISFATRLAGLHIRGSVIPFLRDIDVKALDLVACKDQALRRLAFMAGVDVADLCRNSAQSLGNRRFDLRGNVLSAEFFTNPYTVFCPACLREDDEECGDLALARRGRLIWTLRPVRTCPVHGIALLQRKKGAWDDILHQLALRVPERADALDGLIEGALQRRPSPLQDYVIARLNGARGPSWLDSQTLEQSVRATEMLGVLLAFGPETLLAQLTEDDWDAAGRAGYGATSNGEEGIREALRANQTRLVRQGIKPERANVLGAIYRWLASPKSSKDPGDIQRIVREHIFATIEVAAGTTVLGETLSNRRLHSVESLATKTKLDPRTLRNVLVARGLLPAANKDIEYHVFEATEGEQVAATIQRSTKLKSLPVVLNCTRSQAGQLVDEGILDPITNGRIQAPGRTRKAIGNQDIERFLRDLNRAALPVREASEQMVPISKAAEKAKLSCIEIIHLVLGGFLQKVERLDGVEGYAAIFVDSAEVCIQKAVCLPGISASEAFGRLKMPKSTGWELAQRNVIPRLEPIVIEGKNGQHRFFRFSENSVSAFESKYTTEIRVANANDVPKKDVVAALKRRGVRPVLGVADIGLDLYRSTKIPELH